MKEKITEYGRKYNTPRIWQIITTALLFLVYESMWLFPAFHIGSCLFDKIFKVMLEYYAGITIHLSALGFIIGTIFIWLNRPMFAAPSALLYLIPMIVAYSNAVQDDYLEGFAYGYFLILVLILVSIVLCVISHGKTVVGPRPTTDLPIKTAVKKEPAFNADMLKELKDLLDNGTITQEEFNEKKKQLLDI